MISKRRPAASVCSDRNARRPAHDLVVGVLGVRLLVQEQRAGRRDRGDHVDVAARAEVLVVAGEAARQPDHRRGPDGAGELGLDAGLVGVRVAARVELHGLGDEHGALAVDVDRAALVHEHRRHELGARGSRDEAADLAVLVPGRPLRRAPAVEDPVDAAEHARPLVVEHEGRAHVAHPVVVERRLELLDVGREHAPGAVALDRVDDHRHGLELGHGVRDRGPGGVGLLGRRGVVAERQPGARERHPRALVLRGLSGHAPGHAGTSRLRGADAAASVVISSWSAGRGVGLGCRGLRMPRAVAPGRGTASW